MFSNSSAIKFNTLNVISEISCIETSFTTALNMFFVSNSEIILLLTSFNISSRLFVLITMEMMIYNGNIQN